MAITARLSRSLHQALGNEAADDLVNWMAFVEANRSELRELMDVHNARIDARFDTMQQVMEARFESAGHAMDARFTLIDTRFANERRLTDASFARIETGIAQLETRMERRFGDLLKWSFVFWVGAVGAVAALAGVLK